jgi:hypothetical protein
MRRVAATLGIAALLLPLQASGAGGPRLRIAEPSPLAVRGSGFAALERVTVTAVKPRGTLVRAVVATRAGTFIARFAASADWCGGVREIRAVGRQGSNAAVWVKPALAECADP